jgi:AraC-like DNA-binding protein
LEFLENGFEGFCAALDKTETPVLFCERFDEKSTIWNFAKHKHDCIELLYFLYGRAEVITGGTSVEASFYDAVIYPKGMMHTECLQFSRHQEIYCVWVDIPGLEIPDVIRIQDENANLKCLLEKLHEETKGPTPCKPLINHYVKALAMLIARKSLAKGPQNDMVGRVKQYMQHNMAGDVTVQMLADLVYVSKSYLSRIFRRQTGMSLNDYLQKLRIEAAKSILVSSNLCIEEVSSMVGYHSPKYFYRVFLAGTGMSPRDFRKSEAAGSQEMGSRSS